MVNGGRMPKEYDDCVKGIIGNPDFKPQKGRTKKESAYAICTKQFMKKHGISPAAYDKRHATSTIKGFMEFYKFIGFLRKK